jgi:hypothetical protein
MAGEVDAELLATAFAQIPTFTVALLFFNRVTTATDGAVFGSFFLP